MKSGSVIKAISGFASLILFLNAASAQKVLAEGAENQDASGKEALMVTPDVFEMSAKERAEFEWEYGEEMLHGIADGVNQRITIYTGDGEVGASTVQGVPASPSGASAGVQAQKRDNIYDKDNNSICYKEMTYQLYESEEEFAKPIGTRICNCGYTMDIYTYGLSAEEKAAWNAHMMEHLANGESTSYSDKAYEENDDVEESNDQKSDEDTDVTDTEDTDVTGAEDTDGGDTSLNGLILTSDGTWYYYVNGRVNTGYTGLVYDANVGWWYVENGKINFNYNGLIYYGDAWWCVAGGQVRFDYTGLWSDPNVGWWYVNGGAVDFGAHGLVQNEYGWWYVNGGAVDFGYMGLAYDVNVGWWYVNGVAIDFEACGLVQYGDSWYCVNGGMLDWGYTGLAYDVNVGWWYVNGGAIDFNASGLVYYNEDWYYVNGGMLDWGYTGTMDWNGGTYNVANGVVEF